MNMYNVQAKVEKYYTVTFSMRVWPVLEFPMKILIQMISSFSGLSGIKFNSYVRVFYNKEMVITSS